MKSAAPIAAVLASAASTGWALVLPAADANRGCSNVSHDVLGNSFCREVEQITYTGLAHKGSYQAVTSMGDSADQCGRQSKEYNSSLGVFEEEVCFMSARSCERKIGSQKLPPSYLGPFLVLTIYGNSSRSTSAAPSSSTRWPCIISAVSTTYGTASPTTTPPRRRPTISSSWATTAARALASLICTFPSRRNEQASSRIHRQKKTHPIIC